MKVKDLRDLPELHARLTVLSPVPTLRGPTELDDDDEVRVRLAIGSVAFNLEITAEQYRRLRDSLQPVNKPIALPIELPVEGDEEHDDG